MKSHLPLVQVNDLFKVFDNGLKVNVLEGVSFEVTQGEFIAICGPSGSGKSTLLNIVGTLEESTTGTVTINGYQTNQLNGNELAEFRLNHFGFIFQAFHRIPVLNALENIMLPLFPKKRNLSFDLDEKARYLLGAVGLENRDNHLPCELSGGEKQRVAIARAMINSPSIILADEPTGNLDSKSGENVFSLLKELNIDKNITILMVTHSQDLSRRADRTIFIQDGKLVSENFV